MNVKNESEKTEALPKKKDARPSAAKRGYDHAWRKFRLEFLGKNPMCCRDGCRNKATEVDHEPELTGPDDPGRLDPKRCAPLCKSCHSSKTASQTHARNYDTYRERQAEIMREQSELGRDIADDYFALPECANPERRERGRQSLLQFGLEYFPNRFKLECAEFHIDGAARMQQCTDDGGEQSIAWPRGSGKDTWVEVAIMRAIAYRIRRMIVFFCGTDGLARKSLRKIQKEIETNPLLLADFRGMCFPVRKLQRITRRAQGQTFQGEPTYIEWGADGLTFPTIPDSLASGAMVFGFGLTSAFRGLNILDASGTPIRPDLFVFTDPQTRESSKSLMQTDEREQLILEDALEMVDPTTRAAAFMLCTPIQVNDLAERFLSPDRHPDWRGVRVKMLTKFPDDMTRWDQWSEIRRDSLRQFGDTRLSDEFYQINRALMDAGAVVSWPARVTKGDLSAVQSAMTRFYKNQRGFWAEFQCTPIAVTSSATTKQLDATFVARRLNGLPRLIVPANCTRLTAMIDCHKNALFYAVVAWNERFGGAVIDYGTWPQQARSVFALADVRPSLPERFPKYNDSQLLYAALEELFSFILGRSYARVGGGEHRITKCLVDSGWEGKAVYEAIQRSIFDPIIYPSKGAGRSRTQIGVNRWKKKDGQKKGYHWISTAGEHGKKQQVIFDADAWKTQAYAKLSTPEGSDTALTFWGRDESAHELIGRHCAAEKSDEATTNGDRYDSWTTSLNEPDNHWFDCINGACVAASFDGLIWNTSGDASAAEADPEPLDIEQMRQQQIAEERRRR